MSGSAGSAWPTAVKSDVKGANASGSDTASAHSLATRAELTWPTPMDGTPAQNGNSAAGSSDFSRKAEELARAVMWKTPSAKEPGVENRTLVNKDGTPWVGGERCYDAQTGRLVQTGLPQMVKAATAWQTPRVTSGEYTRDRGRKGTERPTLEGEVAQWPTPSAAQDTKGAQATGDAAAEREKRGKQLALADRALLFSRPDPETPPHGLPSSDPRRTWRRLRRLVISTHGRAVWKRMAASGGKRRLNPNFVAWLMGWPIGHPSCASSATEFSRWQQHMRGALSQLPMASGPWIWKPPATTPQPQQMTLL